MYTWTLFRKQIFLKFPRSTFGISQKEAGLKRDWEVQSGIINILKQMEEQRRKTRFHSHEHSF